MEITVIIIITGLLFVYISLPDSIYKLQSYFVISHILLPLLEFVWLRRKEGDT